MISSPTVDHFKFPRRPLIVSSPHGFRSVDKVDYFMKICNKDNCNADCTVKVATTSTITTTPSTVTTTTTTSKATETTTSKGTTTLTPTTFLTVLLCLCAATRLL